MRTAALLVARARGAGAFTLVELIVVVSVIAVLAAVTLPVASSLRKKGDMAGEISTARQLMTAFSSYAAEHDGQVLPGYGNFPAQDDKGHDLYSPVNNRYPWRIAPYLNYDLRVLYGKVGESRLKLDRARDYEGYVYSVSVAPALGMNTVHVGGDYQMLNPENPRALSVYGAFCITRLVHAVKPGTQIVFASACFQNDGERIPGYFKIEPPNFVTGRRWSRTFSSKAPPEAFGHVDFRYADRAVTAMLDGHVELLDFAQMNDMRRWSNLAAAQDEAGWIPGGSSDKPSSSSSSSSSSTSKPVGNHVDGKPKDGNLGK